MTNYLILGASRGLGHALAMGLPERGDIVYHVSRSLTDGTAESDGVKYISLAGDLSKPETPKRISDWLDGKAIDVFIYNAGIWETNWMGDDFESIDEAQIRAIIETNLLGMILCVQSMLPNVRKAEFGRIILIGSISGLDNESSSPVAYAASKFGVRGVAHALRPICRKAGISLTCLNPGWIANDVPYEDGVEAAIKKYDGKAIPLGDIVELLRTVLRLSPASCVKEIHMPAMLDEMV